MGFFKMGFFEILICRISVPGDIFPNSCIGTYSERAPWIRTKYNDFYGFEPRLAHSKYMLTRPREKVLSKGGEFIRAHLS